MGSESASGGADGAGGAADNLEIWEFGNLEIWEPGNLGIFGFGHLGTWKSRNLVSQKIPNVKILKIQIRSAQHVGKVWISRKKSYWPYLGPTQTIFSMDRKTQKISPIFPGGTLGPIHPVWALAAIHPRWGNRYLT